MNTQWRVKRIIINISILKVIQTYEQEELELITKGKRRIQACEMKGLWEQE